MTRNSGILDAQKTTTKYDDIIEMKYPFISMERRKSKMAIDDRGKIFAPFAALKGYEKAIKAKQEIIIPRMELSEESKEYMDAQIRKIEDMLKMGLHPIITVVYFQADTNIENEDRGKYLRFTGMVAKFHATLRWIQIVEHKLSLDNIYGISGSDLNDI